MPIHGIFYARFLPQEGTKIVAQSPPGCIVPLAVADESDDEDDFDREARQQQQPPQPSASGVLPAAAAPRGKPLFDFEVMQEYVIPRSAFFNRFLAAREPSGRYCVLGLPVAIHDAKYDRNAFIFNFGVVVDTADDQGPYESVVYRLASTFAEMERQNAFLSREEQRSSRKDKGTATTTGTTTTAAAGGLTRSASNLNIEALFDRRRLNPQLKPHLAHMTDASSTAAAAAATGGLSQAQQPPPPVPPPRRQMTTSSMSTATATVVRPAPSPYHRRSIQSLLEIIKEDLNLYGECMIPVDDANTINMKLFPQHANPPAVEGWHVPVPKMRLADAVDPSWDLTLQRVIAHLDGVSDVRRIAFEAGVSLELCRAALRHLLYYDTILLLDLFLFGSCYAPRPGIRDFVANVGGIVDECARYVCLRRPGEAVGRGASAGVGVVGTAPSDDEGDGFDTDRRPPRVSNFDLIRLMTSFCIGRTVTEWLKGHADAGFDVLRFVDVRRLVQFGVIKGCLYRVHKYVVSKQYLASLVTGQAAATTATTTKDPLQRYVDGQHHFDQIITEQNLTEVELLKRLKHLPPGDCRILYR